MDLKKGKEGDGILINAKDLTDYMASVTNTLVFDCLIFRILWRVACYKVDYDPAI